MQKTLRINLLGRNQAVKRAHKKIERRDRIEWQQWQNGKEAIAQNHTKYAKQERQTRRQDWMEGPLAANRNAGTTRGNYGALDLTAASFPTIPRSARLAPDTKVLGKSWEAVDLAKLESEGKLFKGKTLVGNVVQGDRVCVVRGPDSLRGKIGTVMSVNESEETLKIRNMNMVDIVIPAANRVLQDESGGVKGRTMISDEGSIPINHCRLVVGPREIPFLQKDVIVKHIEADAPYIVREYASNIHSHTRYISGLSDPDNTHNPENMRTEIPWPEPTIGDEGKFQEGDTEVDVVNARTYNVLSVDEPVLGYTQQGQRTKLEKRVQDGIMNELVDKYQKSRTRHTDGDWLRKKILMDARSIWWRDRQVLTPEQEQAKKIAETRRKTLPSTIDEETQAMIADMQQATLGQRRTRL